jgi:polar amino acid transport system substrate-binding protein
MLRGFLLFLLCCLGQDSARAAETVLLATYYEYSPWYVPGNPPAGLTVLLARELTARSRGRYRFEPTYIPRRRLNAMLKIHDGPVMAIPWVHPGFFDDVGHTRYQWTGALMEDESLIVSARARPVEYDGPESLSGLRLAAPGGHLFHDLEPLIATGAITRFEVPTIINALQMIVLNRNVDFTVIDRSTLNALKNDPYMNVADLHVAAQPRTVLYTRRMLVPKGHPELFAYLNMAVAQLATDQVWLKAAFGPKR